MFNSNLASGEKARLKIPVTTTEYGLYFLGAAAIIFMLVLFFTQYQSLPDEVPPLFNLGDESDGTMSKVIILLFPLVGIISFIIVLAIGFFPQLINLPVKITPQNEQKVYMTARIWLNVLNAEAMWMFALFFFFAVRAAQGYEIALIPFVIAIIVVSAISYLAMQVRLKQAGKTE